MNVKVQIINTESQGYNFIQDGWLLPNATYRVADHTGHIDFTNWGEKTLTIGSWYSISNVSVRHFKGKPLITSTRDSTLKEDPEPNMTCTAHHHLHKHPHRNHRSNNQCSPYLPTTTQNHQYAHVHITCSLPQM